MKKKPVLMLQAEELRWVNCLGTRNRTRPHGPCGHRPRHTLAVDPGRGEEPRWQHPAARMPLEAGGIADLPAPTEIKGTTKKI